MGVLNGGLEKLLRGSWVALSVEHLTLDLDSGLDFRVVSSSLVSGSMLGLSLLKKTKQKKNGP